MPALSARTVVRGNPPSALHQIVPQELVDYFEQQEAISITSIEYFRDTLAEVQAISGASNGEYAAVLSGTDEGGIYELVGGAWTRRAAIPSILTESTNADEAKAARDAAVAARDAAAISETNAGASEENALSSETAAASSANEAMNSAIAAGAQIYANTTDGLAATASGGLFFVPDGEGNLILYLDDAGVAVEQQRTPLRKYRSVTALKAATEPARGAGTIWEAGGFRFEEQADDTTADLKTVDGWPAPLKVLPIWVGAKGGIYVATAFGAIGDNIADDTAAIQKALDALGIASNLDTTGGVVHLPAGRYKTTATLKGKTSWMTLKGDGVAASSIEFHGTGAAFEMDSDEAVYTYVTFEHLLIHVHAAGTAGSENVGLRIDRMQTSTLSNFLITLLNSHQIGILGKGNGSGSAPYYNVLENFYISGKNDPTTFPGQRGVVFDMGPKVAVADSPNANIISNVKRIAGVEKAFDILAGQGNMFTNVNGESCSKDFFAFGSVTTPDYSGTATGGNHYQLTDTSKSFAGINSGCLVITAGTGAGFAGTINSSSGDTISLTQAQPFLIDSTSVYEIYKPRARDNKIMNFRFEAPGADWAFRNGYAGFNNSAYHGFLTGVDQPNWANASRGQGSKFALQGVGSVAVGPFTCSGAPAGTSTVMDPKYSGGGNGIRVPEGYTPYAITVSCNGVSSGEGGVATIEIIRAGGDTLPELDTLITGSNYFGYTHYIKEPNANPLYSALANINLGVRVTTSAGWASTAASFTVMIWCV